MRNRESLIRLHKFQVDEKRRKVAELEIMLGEFRQRERDLEAQVEEEHVVLLLDRHQLERLGRPVHG